MKQTHFSHPITCRIWKSCLWIPLSTASWNNIQKIARSNCSVWYPCCGMGWLRCRYQQWPVCGVFNNSCSASRFFSEQFHWSFPLNWQGDLESDACREIFAQGRPKIFTFSMCRYLSMASIRQRVLWLLGLWLEAHFEARTIQAIIQSPSFDFSLEKLTCLDYTIMYLMTKHKTICPIARPKCSIWVNDNVGLKGSKTGT